MAKKFLNSTPSVLILGDNIFFGSNLNNIFKEACKSKNSTIFTYSVSKPNQYGVFKAKNKHRKIIEKPKKFISNKAVVGIYFLDQNAPTYASIEIF